MDNIKLKIDTTKMLGFRLSQEPKKTSIKTIIGSKVGDKPQKPINTIIGSKVGRKV